MTSSDRKISRSLPIMLLRGREKVMGPIRAMLADVDITEQQWRVLRVLTEEGAQDPTHIAHKACLLLPSLTRILQKLEEKGLIHRHPDPQDGRKQIVEVTETGANIIRENLGTSIELTRQLRDQMGEDRFELLLDLLNELDGLKET
ncbi:homoprotocatechuate degradation operon regulator HpaR [Falsiruegeria mediterranea]